MLHKHCSAEPFPGDTRPSNFRFPSYKLLRTLPAQREEGLWSCCVSGTGRRLVTDQVSAQIFICFSDSCQGNSSSTPGEFDVSVTLWHPDKCQTFPFTFPEQSQPYPSTSPGINDCLICKIAEKSVTQAALCGTHTRLQKETSEQQGRQLCPHCVQSQALLTSPALQQMWGSGSTSSRLNWPP